MSVQLYLFTLVKIMCTMILGTPSDSEGSLAEDRLALIELKLDESQKTISAERE